MSFSSTTPPLQAINTVLVVEDDAIVRLFISDHLRDRGLRVLEAGSGDGAKAMFGAGEAIDIVFSDVHMPGETDGIALAHWVRDNHPGAPMLLTSGKASFSKVPPEICDQESVFRKPYDLDAVAARIDALLRSQRAN